jgi:hypothetical protein
MNQPFNDDQLRAAYQPTKRRGPDCPSPDALLAAARGEGPEAERRRVLDHALSCADCRPELALLSSVSEPVSKSVSIADRLRQRAMPIALAATVVLAIGVASLIRKNESTTVRGGTSDVVLASPANGARAEGDEVTFVWRPVPGALSYTLEVSAADGTIIHTVRTTDTVAAGPSPRLAPGDQRWWVRVKTDDGSERRSETRLLRVE